MAAIFVIQLALDMKKLSYYAVIPLVFVFVLYACDKHDHTNDNHNHTSNTDTSAPVLTLTSPAAAMFFNGDTIRIKGQARDASLHKLTILIQNDIGNDTLFFVAPTVHDDTLYNINTYWKAQVSGHTNATLRLNAEDHSGNKSGKNVSLHIMP